MTLFLTVNPHPGDYSRDFLDQTIGKIVFRKKSTCRVASFLLLNNKLTFRTFENYKKNRYYRAKLL